MSILAGLFLLLFATIGAALWLTTVPAVNRLLRSGSGGFLLALWLVTFLVMGTAASVGGSEPGSVSAALWFYALCLAPLASAVLTFCWRDLYPRPGQVPPEAPASPRAVLGLILAPAAGALLAAAGHLAGLGRWEDLAFPAVLICATLMDKRSAALNARGG